MLGKEYYVLETSSDNEMFIHSLDSAVDDLLMKDNYIDPTIILKFYFDETTVKEPILYDHIEKGMSPLFSKRVKEVLELFDYFPAVQCVESAITFKDQIFEEYYYLNILNYISCVDTNHSIFDTKRRTGKIGTFDKLVLLEDTLNNKSLPQRLIFRLEEAASVVLFHESVVEAVMKIEPTGLKFYHVDKWNSFV